MPAFLLYDKTQTWFGQSGQLLAGGYVKFFTVGTTTPKAVFGEVGLTTNNGSQIALDSSGRLVFECWGNTADGYYVEAFDADNVKQGQVTRVELPGGVGQTIPIPLAGEFLTGDGAQLLTAEVRQVPDPTGAANKVLSTDGTNLIWIAKPADGDPGTNGTSPVNSATSVLLGTLRIQWGTGVGPASGNDFSTATITFPTPFSAAPYFVTPSVGIVSATGVSLVAYSVTGISATGATVNFNNADRHFVDSDIVNAITFTYLAIGPA